jgi:molybdopterin molybdotransferase
MISVAEALRQITDLFSPLDVEYIPLRHASGRVLAKNVTAERAQPPFAASAMDGYAVIDADIGKTQHLTVVGEAAAGKRFRGTITPGQAVRIFTGSPVPLGADRIIIQEDVTREGDQITICEDPDRGPHIRASGDDFDTGAEVTAPRRLTPSDVALLASMNQATLPVYRKPVVALIATGDELVMPGGLPNEDQIIASNNFGLAALLERRGAECRMLPIARDTPDSLKMALKLCEGADLIVTIGGASVGDYDIVRDVALELGMHPAFYKVAMRPGKPLMAGRMGKTPIIGLPGNPVSSMVCGHIFIHPALNVMQGLGAQALTRNLAQLGSDLPENGSREHYMRAKINFEYSRLTVHPFERQDSALLSVLSSANGLLVRPPFDPAKKAGDLVEIIQF